MTEAESLRPLRVTRKAAIARDIHLCRNRVRERAMSGMDEAGRLQFIRVLEQVRDNLSFPGQ